MKERIAVNPTIHFGKPCVARTRIPVQSVLELVREGISFAEILRDYYPDLEPEDVRAWEERRERELSAPLAAMAAFCAEKAIALYFVTPYGPYFDFTDEELAGMSVQGFLEDAARVHGSERAAVGAEVELITRVVRRVAARGSAQVIDMLEASRGSSLRTSPDFTPE